MSLAQRAHLQAVRSFHIAKGDLLLNAGELKAAYDQYEKAKQAQAQIPAL